DRAGLGRSAHRRDLPTELPRAVARGRRASRLRARAPSRHRSAPGGRRAVDGRYDVARVRAAVPGDVRGPVADVDRLACAAVLDCAPLITARDDSPRPE